MPSPKHLKFAHRFNPDGTVDSICPRCFVTVDSAAKELDLVGQRRAAHLRPVSGCSLRVLRGKCFVLRHLKVSLPSQKQPLSVESQQK